MSGGPSYLITGGAGFVGSHLCDLLLSRGFRIHVVDDLSAGQAHSLCSHPHLTLDKLRIGEAASEEPLSRAIAAASVVFHLASPVGVSLVHNDPGTTVRRIVLAGAQIVELCRRHRRPLLFSSSSEVYGPASDRLSESSPLVMSLAPRSSYAVGKLAVEHMVAELFHRFEIPSWIVRFFNIAGPRQRADAGVVAGFAQRLVAGKRLQVHGDGNQIRCFVHVDDAVEALTLISECALLQGRPVNLGSDAPVSIRELAERMSAESGRPGALFHRSYADCFGNGFLPVLTRTPDTSLLRELTGWKPRRGLKDIIHDALSYARVVSASHSS